MRHLTLTMEINVHRATLLALFFGLLLLPSAFAQEGKPADTPAMKRASVPGGELEYEVRGDGEPVLLIHGSLIAASFLPVMDEDALDDFRLIRYHRRGYAGSTAAEGPPSTYIEQAAADAAALLEHLGVKRAHVVGHSYGGVIALQLALDTPEVAHSLVLLDPAGQPPVPESDSEEEDGSEGSIWPPIELYRSGNTEEAVDTFMQLVGGGSYSEWKADFARTIPGGAEQAVRDAATTFELEIPALGEWTFNMEKAERISAPVLWVSPSGPGLEEKKRAIQSWFPKAEFHVPEGVNHFLQMQDPRPVVEGIADFLRRHPF